MDAIRLENLRSLSDTGYVSLRPLTLLVGRNSSGKSTFVRTLPLLRQSVESRTTGPMLWYGDIVDFGSFDDALRKGAPIPNIAFSFRFTFGPPRRTQLSSYLGDAVRFLAGVDVSATLFLTESQPVAGTRASAFELAFAGHRIRMDFSASGQLSSFFVNSLNVLDTGAKYIVGSGKFAPLLYPSAQDVEFFAAGHRTIPQPLTGGFVTALRPFFHRNTGENTIRALLPPRGMGTDDDMLVDLKSTKSGGTTWRHKAAHLTVNDRTFQTVRDLIIATQVPSLLSLVDSHIADCAVGVSYLAPVRATAQRFYRTQELAVDEVDFQGTNLAMFLGSLSDSEQSSFQDWVSEHFGLRITTHLAGGHISIRVTEINSGTQFNLADVGFGFSQILPVIAQLWAMLNRDKRKRSMGRRTPLFLAIEQPELHLHPHLQARVADVLISAVLTARSRGLDLRVVAETHSETIVNRIGQRIYEGNLDPKEVQVVLFEKEGTEPTHVRSTEYDEEGLLIDWPVGFFDPETRQYASNAP